jgi:hypothetical protein
MLAAVARITRVAVVVLAAVAVGGLAAALTGPAHWLPAGYGVKYATALAIPEHRPDVDARVRRLHRFRKDLSGSCP